ncbi:prolyl oligopeptidase family serine peptidase [Cytophagaceae bacterium YF14B1]|uniref:Prolyl oligopeptidase family serine peptidase n=1 Tax=Xanthocytophaga flava TaxID=3048013 RepID=A0AAE3QS66_9BACT|nr:prolyl oligopeptidase family serine peptidase [Xanthocytophaga flavus]MDJ1482260.1 prolyl oligopeptidase family serine peptidase [Xanthocytophaga flavus]
MKKYLSLLVWWIGLQLVAQDNLTYQTPPKAIADLINAPTTPRVSIDTKGNWMLIMQTASYPGIAELAEPELRIAGLRINPRNNGPSRMSYLTGLSLKNIRTGKDVPVTGLPQNPLISNVSWAPDDSQIAFCVTEGENIQLYVLDVATAAAHKVTTTRINSVLTTPFIWLSDNTHLLVLSVPDTRGALPEAPKVPSGPIVQENLGKKAPSRTYQDLLKSPYDEALFDYYATAQLTRINVKTAAVEKLGKPALIQNYQPSPDGKYILFQTYHKPYSYLVTVRLFPHKIELLDSKANLVKQLADVPLADNIPIGFSATRTGQREHSWRSDAPATLYWIEAQDNGDPKNDVPVRDKVFTLSAPFTGNADELASTKLRFDGIRWGNENLALVSESWWSTRKEITTILNPKTKATTVLFDRSYEDTYNNPGLPELTKNQYGRYVLEIVDNNLIMTGQGASPEGDRPFVDLLSLSTKKSTRLWRSAAPYYEVPVAILDLKKQVLLTRRESLTENPNYFIRNLKARIAPIAVTQFAHPYPQMKDVQKQLLKYKRADGVELSATLYLPAGYKKEDGPLPMLMEAYPTEFKSKDAAGQVTGSPYQFTYIYWGSPVFWATQGYAIMENASIPIVGEGTKEPNDTYIEQLVAGAKGAIDEGVRLGVVDAKRVGVMGHSYGAFMTANLLSHSNLFKAGIARSGAYNRTLTPFGFQAEERTYWQAPDVYFNMSPFSSADKIKTPILLIHGEADNNPGTFPIQSERYYNAIKGHGGTARYVVLPYESHGYRGKESILHMLWEMDKWLDTYVKKAAVN